MVKAGFPKDHDCCSLSVPSLLLASDGRVFSSCFSGHIVLVVLLEGEGSTTNISFRQFTLNLIEKRKKKVISLKGKV